MREFISSPFPERTRCSWTCAGRKRWKTFRPWEPETAARCWARRWPSPSQAGCCCSASAWCFLPRRLPCCCPGSNVSVGALWKSAQRHKGFQLLRNILQHSRDQNAHTCCDYFPRRDYNSSPIYPQLHFLENEIILWQNTFQVCAIKPKIAKPFQNHEPG